MAIFIKEVLKSICQWSNNVLTFPQKLLNSYVAAWQTMASEPDVEL